MQRSRKIGEDEQKYKYRENIFQNHGIMELHMCRKS
jgi:hypothetical protein